MGASNKVIHQGDQTWHRWFKQDKQYHWAAYLGHGRHSLPQTIAHANNNLPNWLAFLLLEGAHRSVKQGDSSRRWNMEHHSPDTCFLEWQTAEFHSAATGDLGHSSIFRLCVISKIYKVQVNTKSWYYTEGCSWCSYTERGEGSVAVIQMLCSKVSQKPEKGGCQTGLIRLKREGCRITVKEIIVTLGWVNLKFTSLKTQT